MAAMAAPKMVSISWGAASITTARLPPVIR